MPRGVDQVEHIRLPIGMGIKHPYRRGLDGDAPLPLDLHGIQELVLHIPQGTVSVSSIIRSARVDFP